METNNNPVPRALVWILGAFLIAFIGVYGVGKAYDISRSVKDSKDPKRTVSISAEGKVDAVPDMATINLGVITRGATAQIVQDQNSGKVNQIVEYAKSLGIAKEDIKTTQFNIYPQYDYSNGRNVIIGYEANQTVTVKVKGIDKSTDTLGKLIDGATDNGANEINGISLGFDDPENLKQEARKQAIDKAKEKAQELARQAGLDLGKVVTISETGGSYPSPVTPYAMDYATGRTINQAKTISPSIEPGSQEITQQMTVVFELK